MTRRDKDCREGHGHRHGESDAEAECPAGEDVGGPVDAEDETTGADREHEERRGEDARNSSEGASQDVDTSDERERDEERGCVGGVPGRERRVRFGDEV
jgi:hypothetical protein